MDREWDSRTGVAVAEQRMTEMVNHLVRLGAPRQLIQNRVQFLDRVMTADGVREPMNRNITITIEYY
ncbi:MAG TPA: hypothetical protein PLN53_07770 [Terricaulis sp.]|nr:hypothetical protein [Terricaulis sp.]